MNDPKNSTRNLAIFEEMLAREPLHKFILFAKNGYCSNEIFEQIAQIEKLKGNIDEVYKNDQDYHTMMKLKQSKSPPPATSYFQRTL